MHELESETGILTLDGAPEHGGQRPVEGLRSALTTDDWLDLSTGVNPWHYPLSTENLACLLQTLPDRGEALQQAALACYLPKATCNQHADISLIMVPGSQWAIEQLPRTYVSGSVALPWIGYREHAWRWHRGGHRCVGYAAGALENALGQLLAMDDLRAVVVINPNNPTADRYPPAQLSRVAQQLAERGIDLIVDEAFVDTEPDLSLTHELPDNAIILRSFGKFFGLPGLRLGAVIGHMPILSALEQRQGPWLVNTLAQHIGQRALRDTHWQQTMRQQLNDWSARYQQLLLDTFPDQAVIATARTSLFITLTLPRCQAEFRHQQLAERGIAVRLWPVSEKLAHLRFGLLREEDGVALERLSQTLNTI